MVSTRYRALIALNVAALALLAAVVLTPQASAQTARAKRALGQYAMVSGQIQGHTDAAVYVVDAANQELIALRWDRGRKVISGVGFRDLTADAQGGKKQGR